MSDETTREVDARTNAAVQPLHFDVDSHDDYLRLREAFSRLPTPAEERLMLAHVRSAKSPQAAWTDLVWALVNTREFRTNH